LPDSADDAAAAEAARRRIALGVAYSGSAYQGWQSQPSGLTIQDHLEAALSQFAATPTTAVCAGRTDAGVHALQQVVHVDTDIDRDPFSWVRGANRYLPRDIAVQWCVPVPPTFHARSSAQGRRYAYVVLEAAVRPALEHQRVGWVFQPLAAEPMRQAADMLIGEHDFSAFRSSQCQALSPVKTLRNIGIARHGAYWRFDFDGSAFLHHMIRNIMGCLIYIGQGREPPAWMQTVLASRNREVAAPTFSPDGLYFLGPYYDPVFGLPQQTPAFDWLPR
jgi:tRNA pseudouridine38-40 synthase